jgi:hypothetical protein
MTNLLAALMAVSLFFGTPFIEQPCQNPASVTVAPATVDCKQIGIVSAGCASFNEMLAAKDKDIVRRLTDPDQAFVCFRPAEDVFTIVNFTKLEPALLVKPAKGVRLEEGAMAEFIRYSDGVEQDSGFAFGKWSNLPKLPAEDSTLAADDDEKTAADGGLHISVNPSELSLTYKWKNLAHTTTTYSLQVRRSTKRSLEIMQYASGTADPKAARGNAPLDRVTYTGYCAEFNN